MCIIFEDNFYERIKLWNSKLHRFGKRALKRRSKVVGFKGSVLTRRQSIQVWRIFAFHKFFNEIQQ